MFARLNYFWGPMKNALSMGVAAIGICLHLMSCSQQTQPPAKLEVSESIQPKLVVGIVVDQMRYDYIYRYWNDYKDDGFKKMIADGFNCRNHHFGYAPTYTGPGHASVYTGTTPSVHGIIGNNWYDRDVDSVIYCSSDDQVAGVGTTSSAGQMSPHRLISSTMIEELELFTNGRSKTVGISLKDRGAILPVGGAGDAAYWFVGSTEGNWVSSTTYMEKLPAWVDSFNSNGLCDAYLKEGWHLLRDASEYDESLADNNPYEGKFTGLDRPVFPYQLDELAAQNGNYDIIKSTPHGNNLTMQFAMAAIEGEEMGQDEHMDFLAVSFSSTDYVGHRFGVQAIEAQDTYLRLDEDLASFFEYLDDKVGQGEYLVFLTADHGAVHVPSYLDHMGVPSGYWRPANMVEDVKAALDELLGPGNYVTNYSNDQFFLNYEAIDSTDYYVDEVEDFIVDMVMQYEGVMDARASWNLKLDVNDGVGGIYHRGHCPTRSGNVQVILKPGWLQYSTMTGTSHGSPHAYDTHVPFLLYGWNINPGSTVKQTYIRDIAPTICTLTNIQMPNGTTGRPVQAVFSKKKSK